MKTYRPKRLFNVPFELMCPVIEKDKGVEVKIWPEAEPGHEVIISASYVIFGGTDRVVNGLTVTADTGFIETWYNPLITASCRLRNLATGTIHDIVGQPEDIEGRHQYMKLRVEAVKGGA